MMKELFPPNLDTDWDLRRLSGWWTECLLHTGCYGEARKAFEAELVRRAKEAPILALEQLEALLENELSPTGVERDIGLVAVAAHIVFPLMEGSLAAELPARLTKRIENVLIMAVNDANFNGPAAKFLVQIFVAINPTAAKERLTDFSLRARRLGDLVECGREALQPKKVDA